ncbi:MAG TPA: CusA/CzcA family heavy metal efflux RND transporter [Blastocatellia bacterium]|nr:CusA/CzcA family heavy metal efflux RND transporter [Blastocatellia bacterium]
MNGLIELVLRERLLVIALAAALLLGGAMAFKNLNIEAYPDPSPPLIEVIAQQPGWSAEEMERQVTLPLETQLNGMPGLEHLRSISLFGLTDIKCYFRYSADYNFVRQEVLNRLQMVTLPAGVQPALSPQSATGEIYRYELRNEGSSLMDLKTAQDWILERQFKQVPGVIDVVSFGGQTKEFHADLDPNKLIQFNVSAPQVMEAIANSNANVGANYLELGEQSYNVRGIGLFRDEEDIGNVQVAEHGGTPIYVKQLGEVSIGAKTPTGRVGRDSNPDIVQGVVLMRRGEKSKPTLEAVRKKVETINNNILPKGMKIVPYYDRTDLIKITTRTVTHTLVTGMILVAFILMAFLGDLRASLVVAISIPLSLMFTFILMVIRGDSANLISMGAIDFGIIVDASVVMVENIARHLSENPAPGLDLTRTTATAAQEVVKPIIFSTAVIVAAFLPLFTMTGVEGKVFGPMAMTYGLALAGALILALTFSPAMSSLVLKPRRGHRDTFLVRWIRAGYTRALRAALANPALTVGGAALSLVAAGVALQFLGGEFMPKLEEGNLYVRASMPNSISFSYASQLVDQMRKVFRKYSEVTTVISQLGRPEDGTDPISFFNCEFVVLLKPFDEWPKGFTKADLIKECEAELRRIPGVNYNFSQAIQDNVEEAMSGVKGENSIKLFGDELEKLEATANQIKDVMAAIPGVADLGVFSELGQPNLLIRVNRQEAARYGILPNDVNVTGQAAIGGQSVTQLLEGEKRFDVLVRFLPPYRQSLAAISDIQINSPEGKRIPLKQLAEITRQTGASFIYREDNARYIPIKFSVRGRDLQSTIDEIQSRIRSRVRLPAGYRYEIAGEFQELQEAVARLAITVPISVLIIFFLLYMTFRNLGDAALLLAAMPFALTGGVFALLITGTNFSISSAVGFVSLFGVSVLGGVILISRIKQLREEGIPLREAVERGSDLQMRPVLMTALAAAIGLLPAAVATGIGSETQRPLARVVVGGMFSSAVVILIVLPAIYLLAHRRQEQRRLQTESNNV